MTDAAQFRASADEIDHVDGWALTRETTIDRLARLCHVHHYMKSYENWTLTGHPANWQWNAPSQSTDTTDHGFDGRSPAPPADTEERPSTPEASDTTKHASGGPSDARFTLFDNDT